MKIKVISDKGKKSRAIYGLATGNKLLVIKYAYAGELIKTEESYIEFEDERGKTMFFNNIKRSSIYVKEPITPERCERKKKDDPEIEGAI